MLSTRQFHLKRCGKISENLRFLPDAALPDTATGTGQCPVPAFKSNFFILTDYLALISLRMKQI